MAHLDGCTEPVEPERNLFCPECGQVRDPGALRTLRFQGFTGPAATSERAEVFWNTGDPEAYNRNVPVEVVKARYPRG
jgi:hypothetical protein